VLWPPFPFIVGCGRSGTTLLRAMCDAHPDLAVPPESHFVVDLAPRRGPLLDVDAFLDRLYESEWFSLWEVDRTELERSFATSPPADYSAAVRTVFRGWANRRGKPRYADKTPGYVLHIPMLARLFPEAVFVHLIRDGRDVACSFRELGWADGVEEAALHWRLRVERGRRAGRALPPGRYREVRYEDLVQDPKSQLETLCSAVDLPFSTAMLDHTPRAAEVVSSTRHPEYHRRLQTPLRTGVRNWRREMGDEDVARFELLAGGTLASLGYERAGVRPSASVRRDVASRWLRWQLHRVRRRAVRAA
jgi:Sulfotransferase family